MVLRQPIAENGVFHPRTLYLLQTDSSAFAVAELGAGGYAVFGVDGTAAVVCWLFLCIMLCAVTHCQM